MNLSFCNTRTGLGVLLSFVTRQLLVGGKSTDGHVLITLRALMEFAVLKPCNEHHARYVGTVHILNVCLLIQRARSYHLYDTHCSTPLPILTSLSLSIHSSAYTTNALLRVNIGKIFIYHILLFGKGSPLFWGIIKRSYGSLSFCWHESDYSYQGGSDWKKNRQEEKKRGDEKN